MEQNTYVKSGVGFTGLLQIAFIILKLCKVINWSWFFVLLPTLLGISAVILGFLIALLFVFISGR